MITEFLRFYLKSLVILLLKLLVVFGVLYCIMMLVGCGEYGYSSPYTSTSYRSSSCENICDSHCDTCWSWQSDILICERDCTTKCRSRGCDYISVPSQTCDDVFQSVCM